MSGQLRQLAILARRRVRRSRWFRLTKRVLNALIEAGTSGYPEETRRRLMILNVVAYLIAVATVSYVIQHLFVHYASWRPVVLINLALVAAALAVPLMHRWNEIAGGLLLVGAEYIALFAITAYLGRTSGVQVQYIVAAAAPFVVFGLSRIRLVLAVVGLGTALHLISWFSFPDAKIPALQHELDSIYTTAVITTIGLIAATVWYAFRLVDDARRETDRLLRSILPDAIADRLKSQPGRIIADSFDEASVMFADISGFVELSARLGASGVVALINDIVREFDYLASRHGVEKIKTIGDCYMVVAGVPNPVEDPVKRLVAMAVEMQAAVDGSIRERTGHQVRLRIGIATGPLLAGVIGSTKHSYDVWGATVNLAARIESHGTPGEIHVCEETCRQLSDTHACEPCEPVPIKSLGLVRRYRLKGRLFPSAAATAA